MPTKPRISQALPSVMIIPRIVLPEEVKVRLTEMALKAYRRYCDYDDSDTEPFAVTMAPVRVQSAVANCVSQKEFEMKLPAFRKALHGGDLRRAINTLGRVLVSDTQPPFPQMRALFCFGDPNSNGLENGSSEQIKQRHAREDLWDTKFSAASLGELIERWQSLMNELHEAAGAGRSKIIAERNFVRALATYWKEEIGCNLYSARSHTYFEKRVKAKQTGAFANFVRAAVEIIPTNYQPAAAWDHAIREVINAMK